MKTKNHQPTVFVKSIIIKELSEKEKQKILFSIYQLAKRDLKNITLSYLSKRMREYQIITLVQMPEEENRLLGFSFSHIYFFRLGLSYFKSALFHCGFTLIAKEFRGRKVSVNICFSLYKLVLKKKMINKLLMFLFGILFTAKCSAPVSFLKIKKFTFHLNWPRIKNKNSLSWLSQTKPSAALSRALSRLLAGKESDDFILRGINQGEDYQLEEEKYFFASKKDQDTVYFFKQHIMPHHELITVAWIHPVFLWLHRRNYAHSS